MTVSAGIVALAEGLARTAHAGQVEKFGEKRPYAEHLASVAALVSGDAVAVAWLHDVIEDTPVTAADLLAAGIPPPIVTAVELVTRPKWKPYPEHYAELKNSGNVLAIAVKIADLKDHLRPVEPPLPPAMTTKYEKALAALLAA